MEDVAKLFGTSGIRGVYSTGSVFNPVQEFVKGNLITSELAWLLGRAVAILHNKSQNNLPVEIWRDVRDSGETLVTSLIHGLQHENIEILYRGIAPTTVYAMRDDRWVIVVTASHNPREFNGFKVFREGRPLVREQEQEIEKLMAGWSGEMDRFSEPISTVSLAVEKDTRQIQLDFFRKNNDMQFLENINRDNFSKCFLPLDLAYGAAYRFGE